MATLLSTELEYVLVATNGDSVVTTSRREALEFELAHLVGIARAEVVRHDYEINLENAA